MYGDYHGPDKADTDTGNFDTFEDAAKVADRLNGLANFQPHQAPK